MSDRLNELLRQRALLQEHVAWIEKEIAALKVTAPQEESRTAATQLAAPAVAAQGSAAAPNSPIAEIKVIPSAPVISPADAEALIQRYGYDPKSTTADVKRGCWVAFGVAFVLLAVVVTAAWFLLRKP